MAGSTAVKAAPKPKREGFFRKVAQFIRESYVETWHKSSWPTWTELRQFTLVVIFALLVVSTWIGGIDFILSRITERFGR